MAARGVLLLLLGAKFAAAQQVPCGHGGCPSSGRTCPLRYNQCPPLGADGTAVGPKTHAATCDPGSAGCKQGEQCQAREVNPFMPLFHVMGNLTDGDGTQPVAVNDVSSVVQWMGVLHVFHQFGQCGWAHALSHDGGVHWKNAHYPLTPDHDPKHTYDQCGCWDGSLTLTTGVNGGSPVILYAPQTSVPAGRDDSSSTQSRAGSTSSDRPIMAVARPSDPSDPELRYWTKDAQNPVSGAVSDMGQIWANGGRWDGMSGGQMFSSNDSALHTWYKQPMAHGFPRGGSGGQWFQELPRTVDGQLLPPGSPTHLVSTGNGQVYSAGWYSPSNETWKTSAENLLLDSGQLNGRGSYTWATLQCSGTPRRCLSVAWVVPAAAAGPGPKSPNSALSLVREVFWDTAGQGGLLKLPMEELGLLRNDTLYNGTVKLLGGTGELSTPALPAGAGDTIDLEASFGLDSSAISAVGPNLY